MTVKQLVDTLLVCDPGAAVQMELVESGWYYAHSAQVDDVRVYVTPEGVVRISGGLAP